jgi:hypothetical protein
MITRSDLQPWIEDALKTCGGSASIAEVARRIWAAHEAELRASGDLFFTWQYDMRWAALTLRKRGLLSPSATSPSGVWELGGGITTK